LDRLARELDLIIVVSAGNVGRTQLQKTYGDDIPYAYPDYLRDACNRIVDPAGAANVLTVGSVAHVNGLAEGNPISIQSLASKDEPSPFTRTGPGIRGALKPDLVDRGGNAVFDGLTSSLKDGARHPPAGVLTLNHRYTEHLFKTASGTSFAAPLVAYKAAMLMSGDIRQSANIIRALLALSAELPQAGVNKLNTTDYEARHSVLGCGIPDITRAIYSDDDRVVLVSESSLSHDQFAIFEIPITEEYQTTGGNREIRVSLAFYPDVRRTRKNYLGTQLQFDLVRGRASIAEIIEAYRALTKEERKQKIKLPSLLKRERCSFLPKINSRKLGTLQHGTFLMKRNIVEYGSTYYLVVRSSSQWAGNDQPFAVGVMLRHTAEISLYERIKARVRIRT
jgi:subtilisin family serine protease